MKKILDSDIHIEPRSDSCKKHKKISRQAYSFFGVKNIMMQRTTNENAASLRRICKRSDQPKIERLVNNDARLILRRKLIGAATR